MYIYVYIYIYIYIYKDFGQYFQMAPGERLSYNKVSTPMKSTDVGHLSEENTPAYSGQRLGHNSTKKIFVTGEDLENLVDRLANEYKVYKDIHIYVYIFI
jgi:hypothetical protein